MGHALNNTIQDILIRYKRMDGFNTLWQPGTDHAGIATQNVVERQLAQENTDRHRIGREKFIERVWEWRKEYGGKIINQLKRLGCSCDWGRERFTMDQGLSKAVREVFVSLYEQGLVYRDDYITNWCPPLPHRPGRPGGGAPGRCGGPALRQISPDRRFRLPDRGHHPAGDHAGRHGRGGQSRG